MADDVVVMYAGAVMEQAPRRDIFYRHHHPYTEGLLASLPAADARRRPADPDPGHAAQPDRPADRAARSRPRCPYAFDRCVEETPPLDRGRSTSPTHRSACWLPRTGRAQDEARSARRSLRGHGGVA